MKTAGSVRNVVGELVRSPIFLIALAIKIIASAFLIGSIAGERFIPFLQYFGAHPFENPYTHFAASGAVNAFPYPPVMLLIAGIPFILFSLLTTITGGLGGIDTNLFGPLLLRLSFLIADVAILVALLLLVPKRKKLILTLYWLSPIVFYATYVQGFLDIIPTALLLIALYLLTIERPTLSAIVLGLGFATKSHLILIVPFILLYLWKRQKSIRGAVHYGIVALAIYLASLVPYVFSAGFIALVFRFHEQYRVFDLAIHFGEVLFYVTIAMYCYVLFKAYSLRKITKNLLFLLISVAFTLFVTLVKPGAGWYVWSVPFIIYFLTKERESTTLYWSASALYVAFFVITPDAGLLDAIHGAVRATLHTTPAHLLGLVGIDGVTVLNVLFTLLSANLLYVTYLMYKRGIKSSQIFQEENGIPVIGIAGDSGSGKTTLSKVVTRLFGEDNVTQLCGDDIHKWERGDKHWEEYTHLNPVSNNIHTHQKQIATLKRGETIRRALYDHDTGTFTEPRTITPRSLIVDEGLHTFVVDNNELYALRIYKDPDTELKLYWKMRRDVEERGHSVEQVLAALERRKPDSEKFISPQRESADLIISIIPEGAVREIIESKTPKLSVSFTVRTDIDLDPLLEAIGSETTLQVRVEYLNNRFQRIHINGHANASEITRIIGSLDIDASDYGIHTKGVLPNISGLMQVFTLYCLDRRLKMRSREGE